MIEKLEADQARWGPCHQKCGRTTFCAQFQPAIASIAGPSGGMKVVSSTRWSRASLIGRLRRGSLVSAPTATLGTIQHIRPQEIMSRRRPHDHPPDVAFSNKPASLD